MHFSAQYRPGKLGGKERFYLAPFQGDYGIHAKAALPRSGIARCDEQPLAVNKS